MKANNSYILIFIFLLFLHYSCRNSREEITYYSNGKVKTKGTKIDGKYEGLVYAYFENGNLQVKSHYINNLKDGLFQKYYFDGKLEEESNWKKGKQHGISKFYFENGNVEISNYINGKAEGFSQLYSRSGGLIQSSIYKDDKQIYLKLCDNKGYFYFASIIPEWVAKDTIKFGENFEGSVKIPIKLKGFISIYAGIFDQQDKLIDTIQVLKNVNNSTFNFSIKPKSVGENTIAILIKHNQAKEDTLSINNTIVRHGYYVIR